MTRRILVLLSLALALWGTFEGFSRDGVLLRTFARQGRATRAESPATASRRPRVSALQKLVTSKQCARSMPR